MCDGTVQSVGCSAIIRLSCKLLHVCEIEPAEGPLPYKSKVSQV